MVMPVVQRGIDGIDHINVYAKGATAIGQLLSNFANTPFSNGGLIFRSVEGWWYWHLTGIDRCRFLAGYAAKEFGRAQVKLPGMEITKERLLAIYQLKCDQNEVVWKGLRDNAERDGGPLPFDHYYIYGGKVVETKWRWTGQLWSEVKL